MALLSDDEFDKALGQYNAASNYNHGVNILQGVRTTPDAATSAITTGKTLGMPPGFVMLDPQNNDLLAKAKVMRDATENAPTMQQWIAKDPLNASLVQDDAHRTAAIETGIRTVPQSPQRSLLSDAIHYAFSTPGQGRTLFGDAVDLGGSAIKGLGSSFAGAAASVDRMIGKLPGPIGDWGNQAAAQAKANQQALAPGDSFVEKLGAMTGETLGTLSQAILTSPVRAAEMTSMGWSAVKDAVQHGIRSMAFPALTSAETTYNNVMEKTGDQAAAIRAAQAQYVVSTMGGVIPFGAGGPLYKRLATGVISGELQGDVSHDVMNAVMPDSMQAPPLTTEDRILSAISGGIFGAMAGPHDVADINRRMNDYARHTYTEQGQAEAAIRTQEHLKQLSQLVAEGKLRERDQERFKQFASDVADGSPVKDLWVDARTLTEVLDQSGIKGEELIEKLPGVADQMRESLQTEGMVRIPMEDYLTTIAGTDVDKTLQPHLRTDPEAKTFGEAQEFFRGQLDKFKEDADKIVAAKEKDDQFKASGDQVQKYVEDQLNQTRRYAPDVSKSSAKLMRSFFETVGQEKNMLPHEVMSTYGLQARSDLMPPGGETLNQTLPGAWPTSKKVQGDLDNITLPDLDNLKKDPKQYEQAVDAVRAEPGMRTKSRTTGKMAEEIIQKMVDNLLWLHDQMPADIRQRAKLWYDGAQRIATKWSETWGKTRAQTAGMLAVLSPQKDWFMNTTMAERVGDILHTQMDHVWDEKMNAAAFRFLYKDVAEDKGKNLEAYEKIKGKTLAEVIASGDKRGAGIWIRAYDEAYHGAAHAIISPEGGFENNKLTAAGEEARRAWGDFSAIGKAASIFVDGRPENINEQIGGEHKVRNFYNNIFNASDARFTTIDTHAVAAALLRPLAGADKAVADNFGATGGTNVTGVSGSYPLYYEAYRRAAEERGLLPREMQSITWEAVRGLYTEGFKNESNKAAIDALWRQVDQGKMTIDEARQQILEKTGGIETPDWWGNEGSGLLRDKTYEQERETHQGAKVNFEVAPDPRNTALKARWDALDAKTRLQVSHDIAWSIAAKALSFFKSGTSELKAELHIQQGGWMADTNPSLSLWMDPNASGSKVVELARLLGYALNQEGMMVTSPKKLPGGDKNGVVVVHGVDGENVKAIYNELRSNVKGDDGADLINGHSTGGGDMAILVPLDKARDIAQRVSEYLGDRHDVTSSEVHTAWPEKGENEYGLSGTQTSSRGAKQGSPLQQAADRLRADAATRLEQAIGGEAHDPGHPGFAEEGPGTEPGRSGPESERLNQGEEAARGQIQFAKDITQQPSVISLLHGADLSTFLHESGHFFLEVYSDLAAKDGADSKFGKDMQSLLNWFGVKDIDTWRSMSLDERRDFHERFARGFEAYLMEGRAPTTELQTLFGRFRSWLVNVYKSLQSPNVELTPEVRGVMDRMLASEEAIKEAEQVRGMLPLFTEKPEGMTEEAWQKYQQMGTDATESAVSDMQARGLRDMQWLSNAKSKVMRELQKKADSLRKAIKEQVTKEVDESPAFAAKRELNRAMDPQADYKDALSAWRTERDAVPKEQREQWLKDNPQPEKPRTSTDDWSDQRAAAEKQIRDAEKAKVGEGLKGIEKGQALAKAKREIDNRVEAQMLEWEKQNPKPAVDKPQVDMDLIAEKHGFTSGTEMLRAIAEMGDRKDHINLLTDQRMLEQHGELTDPVSIERAAEAAIHNQTRAQFIATELTALAKATGSPTLLAKAAAEAAEAAINAKVVGDLNPRQYTVAEGKAAKAAEAALKKGDTHGTAVQKRAQLLNNALAKKAAEAQASVDKWLRQIKKYDSASVAKAIGADYMDRINELLSKYDLTQRYVTKSDVEARMQMREWLQSEFDKTGVMPEVSDALLDFANRKSYKEMTVSELQALMDAVRSLEHVGKAQQEVVINGQKVQLQELVNRAKADLADMPHNPPVDLQPHLQHAVGLDKIKAEWLNLKSKVRGMDAALLKMEQLFQWLTYGNRAGLGETRSGPFLEMFKRAADAEGHERQMRADAVEALKSANDILRGEKINLNEKLNIPELNRPNRKPGEWYREELIAAALNVGNAGNLRKLTEGYGWDERVLMKALETHLSATEWKFVQHVWDNVVGKYGDQIRELQRRQTGVTPAMVEALPFKNKHGDFAGGYYPVVYDAFIDHNIEQKNLKNSDQLFENQWARPMTSKGHTIARTDYKGPIQLSLGVIGKHIDQVTHDLAWREAITDINKFLSHSEIRQEVEEVMGREYFKQFRPWLQALANDKVYNTSGDSFWEGQYRKYRTNFTIIGLGFRLKTMLIHGGSALSNSIGEVGAKWFAKGAAEFASPERWEAAKQFMYERSPEMANRFNEHDRNVYEAIRQINEHQQSLGAVSLATKAVDNAKKFAFYGVSALDMGSAAPTWMGAYLKGMAHEADGGLGLSEEKAVDFANRAVRNAHGGGGVKDLSAVQRDKGVMSMATMFYSFWNHMYNRQRDIAKGFANMPTSIAQGTGTKDFAKLLARSWFYFVIPQLIHAALHPPSQGEQEDGLGSTMLHMAKEVGLGAVSGVPILRDVANAYVNGRDYTITPLEQIGKSFVAAANDLTAIAHGEHPEHTVKHVSDAIGYATGNPLVSGALPTAGTFLWDVYKGEQNPEDIKDWWNGITHGKI